MHLIAPLYTRPYLNREYTVPTMSKALFGSRYWVITIIISIAMHLLIMHGLPWLQPINSEPAGMQSITASFKVLQNPAPAEPLPEILPEPATPIVPLPEPIKPIAPPVKPKPITKTEPVLQAKEMAQAEDYAIAEQTAETTELELTTQSTEAETQSTPSPSANQQTSTAPSTQAQSAPSTSTSNTSPINTPSPSAQSNQENGLLDAYGRDLQRLCERHKQYPSIAIRRHLEGSGSVLVTFNQDGKVISIKIEQSTGESSLDDQAIKMVEKSLNALPLPTKLNGKVMTLSVPVSFRLEG